MTKACETFCKHRNNRQPPLFSFPRLPSSFPAIRLGSTHYLSPCRFSPTHDFTLPPTPVLIGVHRTEIEEVLGVSHWLPHRSFAQSLGSLFMTASSLPHTLSCHSVNVVRESFYVEGRGYYQYKRMPFGLTGGPSSFANMTAKSLFNLLVKKIMELFVDDGGTAADEFEEMIDKLTQIFTRVQECGLSLSASKSQFFVTEMVFAEVPCDTSKVSLS